METPRISKPLTDKYTCIMRFSVRRHQLFIQPRVNIDAPELCYPGFYRLDQQAIEGMMERWELDWKVPASCDDESDYEQNVEPLREKIDVKDTDEENTDTDQE